MKGGTSMFKKVCDSVEKVSNMIIALLVLTIILLTLITIFYRYFLNSPLSWSEQIPRILFVWTTFLGAATLYRRMEHITLDYFYNKFPVPLRKIVSVFNELALLVLFVVYLFYGTQLSISNIEQTYGAVQLSPSVFYVACPVSALLMIMYWFEKNVCNVFFRNDMFKQKNSTMDVGER